MLAPPDRRRHGALHVRGYPGRHHEEHEEAVVTSRNLELLPREECLRLLHTQYLGRVGVRIGQAPSILPVVFAMLDDDIVFRTDPGTKLSAAVMRTIVAFEVDDADPTTRTGWSVLVVGPVEEVTDAKTLARVDALGLEPWVDHDRDYVLRIHSRTVTGRRIPGR
jgi:nitroimidazol reductase NimA-like FMN-containing flavoprotein (pyridoxamine 5'-phosphate oxidase superfamily)